MPRLTQLYKASVIATFLTANTALADVTALQVWDDWQALIQHAGGELDFDQSISDGILTINNLNVTVNTGKIDALTMVGLGSLVLQDQDNGTVMVLLPTDAPIVLRRDKDLITLMQSHKDLSLIVSGTPKDLTYRYKASALSLKLTELAIAGQNVEAAANITLNAIDGTTHSRNADLREMLQDLAIGAVSFKLDFAAADADDRVSAQATLTDFQGSFDLAIPENMETGSLQEVLEAGFKAKGEAGYSDISAQFSMTQKGEASTASLSSKRGGVDMWFGRGEGNFLEMSQHILFGPTAASVDIDTADNRKKGQLALAIAQLGAGYTISFPGSYGQGRYEDMSFPEALDAGLTIKLGFEYDDIDGAFLANDGGETYTGTGRSASAGIDLFLDRDAFRYTAGTDTTKMTMTTTQAPVGAFGFSVSRILSDWIIPLKVTTKPAAFSVHERMTDLSISDNLWAMFDPDGLLPREPLSYIIDVTGMGNWRVDPFGESFQDKTHDGPKVELHSLRLNDLLLSGAGVNLTGTGAFSFDNDDLETFDGLPAPTGRLDLKLAGVNKMLDALIELRLLRKDQAIVARMGLGMFTVVGDGEDRLVSEIKITPDGRISANGKRLK